MSAREKDITCRKSKSNAFTREAAWQKARYTLIMNVG